MQRAGDVVFKQCLELMPNSDVYLVLVGQGNNAGDGYIAAINAKLAGKQVHLCAGSINGFDAALLEKSDVVIDALLGTGINSYIRNEFADIIDAVNASSTPVVSVDVPSGLDANTGQSLGRCVQADITVTLAKRSKH